MALLSLQSYGALLNNYSDVHTTIDKLHALGLHDFIQPGAKKLVQINARKQFERDKVNRAFSHVGDTEASRGELHDNAPSHFPKEELDSIAQAQELQKREMMKVAREEDLEWDGERSEEFEPGNVEAHTSRERQMKPWWEGKYIVAPGFEHRMDQIQQMELEAREGEKSGLFQHKHGRCRY